MNPVMHHIFVWHMPVDGRIAYVWEGQYGDFTVYPMTYHALRGAKTLFGERRVVDPLAFLSSEERMRLSDLAVRQSDAFCDGSGGRGFDFLRCADAEEFWYLFYCYGYFQALIQAVRQQYGNGPVVQYGFFSGSVVSGLLLRIQDLFQLVIDEVNGSKRMGRRESLEKSLGTVLQSILDRCLPVTNRYVRPGVRYGTKQQKKLVFLALEESDRRIQAPLIKKLRAHWPDLSLQWISVAGDRMAVSSDEKRLENADNELEWVDTIEQDITRGFRWVAPLAAKLFYTYLHLHIYQHLDQVPGLNPASRGGAWRIAGFLADRLARAPIAFHGVRSVLDRYQPEYLVVNSSYGLMRTAHAYAEYRGIPIIRFPHGIEDLYGVDVASRGELVAQFGDLGVAMLCGRKPVRAKSFKVCGGMHLSTMALADAGKFANVWPAGSIRILHPVTWWLINFPDAPTETEKDMADIAEAGAAVSARVVVRCHPRQREWNYYDFDLMNKHGAGAKWELSDGSGSLVDEMAASHIIILRSWGGASLQALYSRRPIVAWMPRPGMAFSDNILACFPCQARTSDELSEVFRKLSEDVAYRAQVIDKQAKLLESIVSDPFGDPYAQAEALILQAVQEP